MEGGMTQIPARRALVRAAAAMTFVPALPAFAQFRSIRDLYGNQFDQRAAQVAIRRIRERRMRAMDALHEWHQVALECTGLDHTPVEPGETRVFGEQVGPGRSSRAMAIVHIAMFDVVNAVARRYRSFADSGASPRGASLEAAIAQAAHDTLAALFPSQRADLDTALAQDLGDVRDLTGRRAGIELGKRAAAAIIAQRSDDGSNHAEPRLGVEFVPGDGPGIWRQDPVSKSPLALGANWSHVKPFVLRAADQFRIPPPPGLDSAQYVAAFNEVKRLGGDGDKTPTVRSEAQRQIGVFWAYDGVPTLCAPPRLYNQIVLQIATQRRTGPLELARLLALVNIAMAEAGLASWESKYFYKFWRPVTAIREASGGVVTPDPNFMPLGARASNLTGPNFTPPFPAYPSGHATFGGAVFQTLRDFYGTDRIPFTFVSDEFNGVTEDNTGNARPRMARTFQRLSEAEEENGQSRIYLGIHWVFDKTEGIAQGRRVARFVAENALQPA
jgi:hypothetical protein